MSFVLHFYGDYDSGSSFHDQLSNFNISLSLISKKTNKLAIFYLHTGYSVLKIILNRLTQFQNALLTTRLGNVENFQRKCMNFFKNPK